MKNLILLLLLIPLLASAQEKGTHFEHGLTWEQVKEKAKKENKYLFVDCFTTWCGPCKDMANNVFPQEKVGDFFNKNFVNVKIQFDKTKNDSDEVKSWYAVAAAINKEFKVRAYPTFLIFSPKGELVHRIVGGGQADEFIAKAQEALDPETQYYTRIKKYGSGNPSPQILKELVSASEQVYEQENAAKFASSYLDSQKDLYTKDNLYFLSKYIKSSKSKGFEVILKDTEKVDKVLGKGRANEILSNVIIKESIYPELGNPTANIDSLIAIAASKYPKIDMRKDTELMKVKFYQEEKDWDKFQPAVLLFMKNYGEEVNAGTKNSFAWAVFKNSNDLNYLNVALEWSKHSVDATEGKLFSYIDTYANLLYKLGKKKEAITLLEKARESAPTGEKGWYSATIDSLKNNEI